MISLLFLLMVSKSLQINLYFFINLLLNFILYHCIITQNDLVYFSLRYCLVTVNQIAEQHIVLKLLWLLELKPILIG
jgi:hypothetical protein